MARSVILTLLPGGDMLTDKFVLSCSPMNCFRTESCQFKAALMRCGLTHVITTSVEVSRSGYVPSHLFRSGHSGQGASRFGIMPLRDLSTRTGRKAWWSGIMPSHVLLLPTRGLRSSLSGDMPSHSDPASCRHMPSSSRRTGRGA